MGGKVPLKAELLSSEGLDLRFWGVWRLSVRTMTPSTLDLLLLGLG